MKILVTGAAGFIGFHTAARLLNEGHNVLGVDSLNDYYDVQLKKDRLAELEKRDNFRFIKQDLADTKATAEIFSQYEPTRVIHLAAQAGVRYSLQNPHAYVSANLQAFLNILEGCRANKTEHLVYASTSSVYGANTQMPFSEHHNVDHPLSLYAATKKSNELMAHTYAHLYDIPVTGLRFFTVYGPWGRPDMALFTFTRKILAGEPIDIYNGGNHARDFTYIDDIVEGVIGALHKVATPDPNWSSENPSPETSAAPYRVYNIGNNKPVELMTFVKCLEDALGQEAEKNMLPLQPGDVPETYADISRLSEAVGFSPKTSIEEGITHFVKWYRDYYKV